jgi:hypothetical protein
MRSDIVPLARNQSEGWHIGGQPYFGPPNLLGAPRPR